MQVVARSRRISSSGCQAGKPTIYDDAGLVAKSVPEKHTLQERVTRNLDLALQCADADSAGKELSRRGDASKGAKFSRSAGEHINERV